MQTLPQHTGHLRPFTWTRDTANPVQFAAGALTPALEAVDAAFEEACQEKERKGIRANSHVDEPGVYAITLPLNLPAALANNPNAAQALDMAQLLANLALNPRYTGEEQCGIEFMHGYRGDKMHPLRQQTPEYLDHGVSIRHEDGEWKITFFSKNHSDLRDLLGSMQADGQAPYPLTTQLRDILQQWRYALERELADPKRWNEEFATGLAKRKETCAGLAENLRNTPFTYHQSQDPQDLQALRTMHTLSLRKRAELFTGGYTPLMVAVADGHEDHVISLLTDPNNRQNPNAIVKVKNAPDKEASAYTIACQKSDARMIRLLAHYGEKPTYEKAMADAISMADENLVRAMAEVEAPVTRIALFAAIQQPNDNIFRNVLRMGQEKLGGLVNYEVIDALLESGRTDRWNDFVQVIPKEAFDKIAAKAGKISDLLHKAVCKNMTSAALHLLRCGGNPNHSATFMAAAWHHNTELCEAFIKAGGSILERAAIMEASLHYTNYSNNISGSPLEIAIQKQYGDLIELFTNALARPIAKGGAGPKAAVRGR